MGDRRAALVTGASRGIGAATAEVLAARGYDVTILARTKRDLEQTARRVEAAGGKALVQCGDLGDLEFAEAAVAATIEQFGRIDVLVNNAAWRDIISMRDISIASWEKTLRISLTAPAFLAKWAAADMVKRTSGVIVNVSSIQSQRVSGFSPAYVACKGALDSLTRELATLYGPRGIRVVTLNPGAIDTEMSGDYESADGESITEKLRDHSYDMIPLKRWGEAKEMATTIAMLVSDDASYITGTTIYADGGYAVNLNPYGLKHLMFPDDF
jgi:3-oxoacyl-[acyl-carrier protein] reductase